ncbi:hypothetical protein MEO94_27535 [Dolichospermum sp. ST_sed9]|nr:hypothetical protein [Dolichospermum sp. ST_sed9]
MHKALKRFTTILLSSFFLIVFINFAVIAEDTGQKTPSKDKPLSVYGIQRTLKLVILSSMTGKVMEFQITLVL